MALYNLRNCHNTIWATGSGIITGLPTSRRASGDVSDVLNLLLAFPLMLQYNHILLKETLLIIYST
jgi:hypothetical protein